MKLRRNIAGGLAISPLLIGISGPCAAAPVTYNFSATVAAACSISGKATAVTFGALTSGTTAVAPDDAASCNQGRTTATIQRTNLKTANVASTGFTNSIPMAASLTTAQGTPLADASADPGAGTSIGTSGQINAFTGLTVTATLGSIGTSQLVAGTYAATVTVTLTPTS